jgi:isocitrate/isopropylmalate dehydrogenase
MVKSYKIAVLKGDGIGPEVTNATVKVLDAVQIRAGFKLDYLGEKKPATQIEKAVIDVLSEGKVRTADLGGSARTDEMADAIADKIKNA